MKSIFNKTASKTKNLKQKKIFYNRVYYKLLSTINGFDITVNSHNFEDSMIKVNFDALTFKEPVFQKLSDTYVLIRNLKFQTEIKLIELQKFENFVKWKSSNLNFIVILRNYTLKFFLNLKNLSRKIILINIPNKVRAFDEKQINIAKSIKVTEEIIQILPYTRVLNKQKLFRFPISRRPLYKSYFPDSEMKRFREELAIQNKTRWTNVEILEIYDKFNVKLFSEIKQTSGSKNLLCYPSFSNADMKIDNDFYYLVIGKRRDTSELVKALSRPVTIQDDYKNQ